ncbi:uncharacterized protein LOC114252410 [Bombyx mandarina]|uniref:Uncharacterized protein LOC114252410 n=1 Tax=Bombyx mandarina TaxID=7092 RepID=A0A6J2KKQ4_BOMMA|nr:uncharacterized protein LOC114252410 [Bombyx mandarina]
MCLHGSDRRGWVHRRPGERFAQCCFAETVAYGVGSCMMWAGISFDGKTELVFVPGGGRGGGQLRTGTFPIFCWNVSFPMRDMPVIASSLSTITLVVTLPVEQLNTSKKSISPHWTGLRSALT